MATSDGCPPLDGATRAGASISGLAFSPGRELPGAVPRNGLFVADYSRNCIVVLPDAAEAASRADRDPVQLGRRDAGDADDRPERHLVYGEFGTGDDPSDPLPAAGRVVHGDADRAAPRRCTSTSTAVGLERVRPATITAYDWDFGDGSGHGSRRHDEPHLCRGARSRPG